MKRLALIFVLFLMFGNSATARQYGSVVAASENLVIAGDGTRPAVPGDVYIYSKNNSGNWIEKDVITASDADGSPDSFGRALAVDGSTIIVGAPRAGKAYVYRQSGSSWQEEGILTGMGQQFGSSVAIDGSAALVSGTEDTRRGNTRPTVEVFRRQESGSWEASGQIESVDRSSGTGFGDVMILSDDLAIISAPASANSAGVVFVYRYAAESDTWTMESQINSPVPRDGNRFGASMELTNGVLAVGSPGHSYGTGAVFIYKMNAAGSNWSLQGQLSPYSARRNTAFGTAIAIDGDRLWVGAPGDGGPFGTGAVYEYDMDLDTFDVRGSQVALAPDLQDRSRYGNDLAATGQLLVVGSPGYDHNAGVVFAVDRSGSGWAISDPLENDIFAYDSMGGELAECEENAVGDFPCEGVDMMSFISVADMGADRGIRTNDLWGWEDPETGREYAIVGFFNQTSFVDVTDPFNPIYLGELDMPTNSNRAPWRDMKVYKDHAYIVADGAGAHGIQIFDLRQLRDVQNAPVTFEETAHYSGIFSAHNIVINEDTGFAYSVGSSAGGETCGGGLHMIDIREPAKPVFAGCYTDGTTGRRGTGFSHDAQCVVYHGPDEDYTGHEICIGSNETAISIADVTDKKNPVGIAIADYPGVAYAHQGWLTDDHRYFYLNDELDESQGLVDYTRTLIWDFEDLDEPQLAAEFLDETTEGDHNLYVKGNFVYQSITSAGLRILDISDPEKPFVSAYFDTSPVGGRGVSWSNYPYFKSGIIVVTAGHYGLFVLQKKEVDI